MLPHRLSLAVCSAPHWRTLLIAGGIGLAFGISCAGAARGADVAPPPFSPEQLEFFESKVRPLLAQHCFECHSRRADPPKAGLRLDQRATAIQGGESGPAIVPHKPDESPLIAAVRWKSLEMPPQGKLKDADIATLVKWVEWGAPWPKEAEVPQPADQALSYDWARWRREHWAYQPVVKPVPPAGSPTDWGRNPVDQFVLAQLTAAGLGPPRRAEPRVLVRRVYLDLLGLPPTFDQSQRFCAAAVLDPDRALAELVDELLASPHYGERWGRHWLDVARYSDGYGGFLDNAANAHAWRYRDWVVQAFNRDLPLDQFLELQIAGDLIDPRGSGVATGFFALGPTYISDGGDPDSIAQAQAETLADRIDTLGQGMLGLTLACARCHDHKFDPLPQQDYYSLAGIFQNTGQRELPLAPDDVVAAFQRHQQASADLNKQIGDLKNRLQVEKREPTADEQQALAELESSLARRQQTAPPKFDVAHALLDTGSADMPVAIRGNLRKPGPLAPRRFPRILAGDDARLFRDGSGRRQLAQAVADPANPLTTRVFVNRVWMHHFGAGLVRSPSNFGALGEKPTHPQLLDWLAATWIESGRSIKQLHRLILTSATYQATSEYDDQAFVRDGDNRLLWRMNPRRLDAEAWRDTVLSVTGELEPTLGGPPADQPENRRRTLYFKVSRNGDAFATDEFLRLFDFPLMRATIDRRPTTVVPQQFLFLLNSPFMIQRAKAFAQRLTREASTDSQRIELAYRLLYQRPVQLAELELGLTFLAQGQSTGPELSAWDRYAQVLLGSNELMYVQ